MFIQKQHIRVVGGSIMRNMLDVCGENVVMCIYTNSNMFAELVSAIFVCGFTVVLYRPRHDI